MHPLKHDPAKPLCFLTHCSHNLEASRTNVSEETLYNWQPCHRPCAWPATEVARARWMGQGHPGQPNPSVTRTMLVQLCTESWVSRSCLAATQPGIEPGSVVAPQSLQCSALDCCATLESVVYQMTLSTLLLWHSLL
jgi:hypothetical protein